MMIIWLSIQIVEMLRNIYVLDNKQSFDIFKNLNKNLSLKEKQEIANSIYKIIAKKNDILQKLSLDITKIVNKSNEKSEKEKEIKNFNI